jgi:hypothetical protein
MAAPILANLLDAISTDRLLNSGRYREGNPLMAGLAKNDLAWYGSKLAVGAFEAWLANHLAKKGKRGQGKAVSLIGTGLAAGPAAWNLTRK